MKLGILDVCPEHQPLAETPHLHNPAACLSKVLDASEAQRGREGQSTDSLLDKCLYAWWSTEYYYCRMKFMTPQCLTWKITDELNRWRTGPVSSVSWTIMYDDGSDSHDRQELWLTWSHQNSSEVNLQTTCWLNYWNQDSHCAENKDNTKNLTSLYCHNSC